MKIWPQRILLLVLCVLLFAPVSTGATNVGNGKPNIILVMADDQGWGDTGYNGHPFVQTPTLDSMADNAFVLDRFYAAAPVCSPTRASVMTGRAPVRTKVTNHGRYMRPHEQTLGETLKAAGYVTGFFGKFHLGSGQRDSPCNPTGMGFDEWSMGLNFFDNDPFLSRNGKIEHRKGKGSVLAVDDTIEFLNKHKHGEHPLFAVVWFPSPHDPHQEVPDGESLYDGKKHAGYYREITLLDQQLGRLRAELKKNGISENTILWYCSDNGGLVEETSGGRGRKGSIYDGGLRVPSIIEWPARKLKGRSEVPAWTCDIYPTVLAMAGVEHDAPHPLDGIDISNILFDNATTREKPMGFWHKLQDGQTTWNDRILKSVMEKQKANAPLPHNEHRIRKDVDEFPQFAEDTSKGHAAWIAWPWKLHRINGNTFELYNLTDDPNEATDLSAEPAHQDRLVDLKAELNTWMRSVIGSLNGHDYVNVGADASREIEPFIADYSTLAFYPKRWKEAGIDFEMLAWEGEDVVLLTKKGEYDAAEITAFVKRLDDGWTCYAELVGRKPRRFKTINDKAVICALPKSDLSCGYGCGFVGATGIEASAFYRVDLPNFRKNPNSFQDYYFYEMGRNYFVFGDRHSLFTTGYAVFMRYVCMDRLELDGRNSQTRRTIESCEVIYANSDIKFFDAFTNLGSGEKSNRLKDTAGRAISPSDQPVMYATAMLKLRRDFGGDEWVKTFYHTLRKCRRSKATDIKSAKTQAFNWLVCASVAAKKDLTFIFADRWRMPMTANQRSIMKEQDWSAADPAVAELVADLIADKPLD
ncbi:sulfatase-like hydrolase/transferase [Mariniblastus fucicola]|uniref:Choline-sulfatase n=1 Tax=Mariniblastus fucicola TaxID=980251 RepID=A0A5B9PL49_9BACT|nr:sulfatase-like hydrolase/transferase [Mariniblastus fucicola]QEG23411.1 Choline-sulfatase [Mariniblastus fucicola]